MARVDDRSRSSDLRLQQGAETKGAEAKESQTPPAALDDGVPELSELTGTSRSEGPAAELDRTGNGRVPASLFEQRVHTAPTNAASEASEKSEVDPRRAAYDEARVQVQAHGADLEMCALEVTEVSAEGADCVRAAAGELDAVAVGLERGDIVDVEGVKERVGAHMSEAETHVAEALEQAKDELVAQVPEEKRSRFREYLDGAASVAEALERFTPPGMPLDMAFKSVTTMNDLVTRYEKAGSVREMVKGYLQEKVEALDDLKKLLGDVRLPSSQIETLRPGENVTWGAGVHGKYAGIQAGAQAKLTLACEQKPGGKPEYVVQEDRTLSLGGELERKGGAKVEAGRQFNVRLEMRTPDKEVAQDLANDAALRLMPKSSVATVVASHVLSSEHGFDQLSAIELTAADAAKLGISIPENQFGSALSVGAAIETTVRLEIHEDKIEKMVVKRAYKLEGAAEHGFKGKDGNGAGLKGAKAMGVDLILGKTGGAATLTVEQEYDAKQGLDAAALLRGAAATHNIFVPSTDAKTKVSVELDAQREVRGFKAKLEAEIGHDAQGNSLLKGALEDLVRGDLEKGLERLSSSGLTASVTPYRRGEQKLQIEAETGTAGGGVSLEHKREIASEPIEKKGNAKECLVFLLEAGLAATREDEKALAQLARNRVVP